MHLTRVVPKKSFSFSLSLYLSLSFSISLFLSLSLSISLYLSISLTVALSPSLALYIYLYLSLSHYLSLALYIFLARNPPRQKTHFLNVANEGRRRRRNNKNCVKLHGKRGCCAFSRLRHSFTAFRVTTEMTSLLPRFISAHIGQ